MKKMKRLAALFLAVVMVMAMGLTAFAEPEDETDTPAGSTATSTITIKGSVPGETYTAYKIFNVGKAVNGETTSYSYTRPKGKNLVPGFEKFFDEVDNGGETIQYNVKEKLAEADLIEYLQKYAETIALKKSEPVTAAEETTTTDITGLEDGYYYVKSTANNGAAAMLRAVDGDTEITEKNTVPGWGDNGGKKSYKVDKNGNLAYDANRNPIEEKFYAVGETIEYVVTYENAQNYITKTGEDGKPVTERIYQYVAKDTMPDGIVLDKDTIDVKVDGQPTTKHRFTGEANEKGFNIIIPWAPEDGGVEDFYYNAPAEIVITYQATVTKDVSAGEPLTNTIKIDYNDTELDEGKENKVYTGSLQVLKFDSTDVADPENVTPEEVKAAEKLADAEFIVVKNAYEPNPNGVNLYLKKEIDQYGDYSWAYTYKRDEAYVLKTDATGKSEVLHGLKAGEYYLLETKAPDGYNMLTKAVRVMVEANEDNNGNIDAGALITVSSIGNARGAVLPSTGGIGTTIFYVVGGILVLGAGVLLITKKRMSAK